MLGHSDADVLVHAVMDAILGALALGDIGKHFPDTDYAYKNINSMILLGKVIALASAKGYRIGNIDATVIALKPKLAPYIQQMRANIAQTCYTDTDNVSVKATTEEGLGLSDKGIGAHCVVIMEKK